MNRVTLEQISSLPPKEMRQAKACFNEFLGTFKAARKRLKKVAAARNESEVCNELSSETR